MERYKPNIPCYTILLEVYWKETNTNTHTSQIYHAILYFWRFIGKKLVQTHIQAKYTMLYYTFRPLVAPSRKTNEVHSVCIELFLPYFYLSFQIRQQYRKYLMHEIFEIHSFTKKVFNRRLKNSAFNGGNRF